MTARLSQIISQVDASVESIVYLCRDIVELSFVSPEISCTASPGQFVMVRAGNEQTPLLRRPFSVHFADGRRIIRLLIKIIGPVTRRLAALSPGDTINIIGPLGHGFPLPEKTPVYLAGGGIGVAPLLFLATRLIESVPPSQIKILLGARNGEEAQCLAATFIKFGFQPQLATDDGSAGHHGVVGDLLSGLTPKNKPAAVYTCGPHPMLAAIAALCRDNSWPCYVSMETMMACGVAACLGCAVPAAGPDTAYLHACKEGPVFNAEELQW